MLSFQAKCPALHGIEEIDLAKAKLRSWYRRETGFKDNALHFTGDALLYLVQGFFPAMK